MTIFVSIASYRDPELIPTIEDMIAKAYWPGELRIGVCWQSADGDPDPIEVASRGAHVARIRVPYAQSQGACWARSRIQRELFNNEDFFLQIDSHHRFVQDWDRLLLAQIMGPTMPNKPVLSTYVPGYEIGKTPIPLHPCMMRLDKIESTGVVLFQSWPAGETVGKPPVRARFVSGHFLFAPGHFVEQVPYDPALYFTGEEMTLALRAFTHGYDLFHPTVHLLWHEFSRKARVKHWEDHERWWQHDAVSKQKVLKLLQGQDIGPFGVGTARTIRDYETYSGLDFTKWTASADAFKGNPPV
jgi:Glycosyltransferase (GlcNAc)